ncbi:MAG: Na/Pi cotransporter family protein [Clostridia bacterium]|nr:Na/Pi cotransporter family protein [Clostridia bacterium]MBR3974870.1 Na/Pi cotransporter family protein [Clostridia bacterium]
MDIFSVISFLLGITFFLFGMKVMSGDLEKLAGGRLEALLKKVTKNPLLGLIVGIAITMAVQSSSAVTVILVGLVNSGIMQFAQSVYVIFGANIGTTITAWLLSLSGIESDSIVMQMMKPVNFAPILAFIGVIFLMFSKNEKKKSIGTIFIGFTVLMYGMDFMTDSVDVMVESYNLSELFVKFSNPLLGVLIGALVTAVIQSSSASVGILQALAMTGAITYGAAIPIIMGQNIGTCITALISAVGTNAKARRVAVVHTAINVIGTLICLTAFEIVDLSFAPALFDEAAAGWSIAVIHSVFNISITVILMPFTKHLARLTELIVPDKTSTKAPKLIFHPDERLLTSPSIAANECDGYSSKMCETAKEMLITSFSILCNYDRQTDEWINMQEETLDSYEDGLGTFLVKLSSRSLSEADSKKITKMLHAIGNFERLGDHSVNLLKTSREIKEKKIVFSPEAYEELTVLTDALIEIITITSNAYIHNDIQKAMRVEPLEQLIDKLISVSRKNHVKRMKKGECTFELGFVFSDILTNCERISDHCSNIAVTIIEADNNSFDTHKYLNDVKANDEEFKNLYAEFKSKYSIEKV